MTVNYYCIGAIELFKVLYAEEPPFVCFSQNVRERVGGELAWAST